MPKMLWGLSIGLCVLLCNPAEAQTQESSIEQHVKKLQTWQENYQRKKSESVTPQIDNNSLNVVQNQPQPPQKSQFSEQSKDKIKPVAITPPSAADDKPKRIRKIPDAAMHTQPHGNMNIFVGPAHRAPGKVVDTHPQKPHKKHEHAKPENPHLRPKPVHKPTIINHYTYISSPSVTRLVTDNNVIVYEANPHIYAPNAYNCFYRNELKYCTDYRGKALNGRIVQNYADSIAYENYKKGYLSGETTVYTPDGILLQTTNYSKSLKHGKETVYFADGKVYYTVNYNKGKLNGSVRQYDENGVFLGEMTYSNGYLRYRYCRNDASDAAHRARVKAKIFNDLVLCIDEM